MKHLFICILFFVLSEISQAQNIGINSNGVAPNSSAMLDIVASNKGILLPRVTLTSTGSTSPIGAGVANSLLVYNTATVSDVTEGYYYWDNTQSKWVRLIGAGNSSGGDWSLTGNAATVAGTNFIGTTNDEDWVIKTDGTERMRVNGETDAQVGYVGIGTASPISNFQISETRSSSNITMLTLTSVGTGGFGDTLSLLFQMPATGAALRNAAQISAIHNSPANNQGNLAFFTGTGGALAEAMRITHTGEVGIATTVPTETLDINGTIRIRGVAHTAGDILISDGTGVGSWSTMSSAGATTGVTAGTGLTGGGTNGVLTLNVIATNGITSYANDIRLGGTLTQATTILQGANNMVYNLDGTGDFIIQDNGSKVLRVYNTGNVGIGSQTAAYKLDVTGEITSRNQNAFRLRQGNYSFFLRNDNVNTYMLLTAAGSPDGGFNTLRPFSVNNASGNVNIGNGTLYTEHLGNVGIGTTSPSYKLHVVGRLKTTGINETSDARFKKDVVTITDPLTKVMALRGVTFNWKIDEYSEQNFTDKPQMGVIAQEVEEVIPEVVDTDADGYKSVEYSKMVGLLIEAIKEQQKEIAELKKIVNDLSEKQ